MKKSINSGFYANWNENEPKRWLRFNGTYTAEYDSDGIAKLMSAVFRAGPPQTSYEVEVQRENGVITGAVVNGDILELFYTGNVEHPGDYDYSTAGRDANQIRVSSKDGRAD